MVSLVIHLTTDFYHVLQKIDDEFPK